MKVVSIVGARPQFIKCAPVSRKLRSIFAALERLAQGGLPAIVPLHPRTRKAFQTGGIVVEPVRIVPPVSYKEMLSLEANARVILTDSGGVQKEAYWVAVPCVTLREETEWAETVAGGWKRLAGCDPERIVEATYQARPGNGRPPFYGYGPAAGHIVRHLVAA